MEDDVADARVDALALAVTCRCPRIPRSELDVADGFSNQRPRLVHHGLDQASGSWLFTLSFST